MKLKDIAEMAGVSVATVSNVLNHKENKVSVEVEQSILNIIKEVDYHPDRIAKSLRSKQSKTIGVLTEDLSVWQVGKILQGITQVTEKEGFSVIISNLDMRTRIHSQYDRIFEFRKLIEEEISKMKSVRVGGLIFIGMHDRNVDHLINTDLPLVYAYCSTDSEADVQIHYDNKYISKRIIKTLIRRYGIQPAVIRGPLNSTPANLRMEGICEAVFEAGMIYDERLCEIGTWEFESGVSACRKILDRGIKFRTLFACNDQMALGAMHELLSRGLRIPDDIEVMGFDDIEACKYMTPSLTTIHVPLIEIGRESVIALDRIIRKEQQEKGQIYLDCQFVERGSMRISKNVFMSGDNALKI